MSKGLLSLPIRRNVVFERGGSTTHGFVEITGISFDGNNIRCDIVAELGQRWERSVVGVDVMQALSVAIRILESQMEDVRARVE